jgi:MFS family permease
MPCKCRNQALSTLAPQLIFRHASSLVLFIGYVAMQIPAGFILAKIPPVLFLTGAVTTWGVVSMCCGFVKTAPQLLALRFLVGVAEAVRDLRNPS